MINKAFLLVLLPSLITAAAPVNYARKRPIFASTTNDYWKAVDGNTNSHYIRGRSCTQIDNRHTGSPVWLLVDLQEFILISSVVLYNRRECCSERLRDFYLELHSVNPQLCGSNASLVASIHQESSLPGSPTTYTFSPPRAARWVQVEMRYANATLHVCELEVYGQLAGPAASTDACLPHQFRPQLLPLLGSLDRHAPFRLGPVQPSICAAQCLRHRWCTGFYFLKPHSAPQAPCFLLLPRTSSSPPETEVQGPLTFYEVHC